MMITAFLDERTRRERILILAALPLALFSALHFLVWVPLDEARATKHGLISDYLTVQEAVRLADTGSPTQTTAPETRPLATRVTDSARTVGLALRRLDPEGSQIRVTVDEADFIDVLTWISDMEAVGSLRLVSLELDRRPAPGTVSARLTLEDLS